jgi:predicted nucleic acid-binding protein
MDANVLFAALIKDSHTRHLIVSGGWMFYIPEFLLEEMRTKLDILTEKTGLTKEALIELLDVLVIAANITAIPSDEFREYSKRAEDISPDPDDAPYFALAMKLGCAIWSNDGKLKQQNSVKVYTTEELSAMI